MIIRFNVDETIVLKDFLKQKFPSRLIVGLNKDGRYIVNNQVVKNYYLLKEGDYLEIVLPKSKVSELVRPIYQPLKIVYEDSYLLVVDKENDTPVTPTKNHETDSLASYLYAYYMQKGIDAGIHLVSRLDLATTGLIVVAKNAYIKHMLQSNSITKKYLLLVEGDLASGYLETGLENDQNFFNKRMVTAGNVAKTRYDRIKKCANNTLISAHLITGKTHQLRVHFAYLGHPIVGDKIYGKGIGDLRLHSHQVIFTHPITQKEINLTSLPLWLEFDL